MARPIPADQTSTQAVKRKTYSDAFERIVEVVKG
jgi:hypothetical protein